MLSDVCLSDVCHELLFGGVRAATWNSLPASVRDDHLSVAAFSLGFLQLFREYLLRNIHTASAELKQHRRPEGWVFLAKLVLSRLILFNKRRRAEVRELRVDEYLAQPNWKDDDGGEMDLALSPTDCLLAQM